MQCSFETCDKEVMHSSGKYAGLCIGHKAQVINNKELVPLRVKLPRTLVANDERFLSHIDKTDGCWLWKAGTVSAGYGTFSVDNRTRAAHRVAYEMWVAPIEPGTVIHHTCAVRLCVNPAHLQAVTAHENTAEMLERQSYLARIAELEQEVAKLRPNKRGWFNRAR